MPNAETMKAVREAIVMGLAWHQDDAESAGSARCNCSLCEKSRAGLRLLDAEGEKQPSPTPRWSGPQPGEECSYGCTNGNLPISHEDVLIGCTQELHGEPCPIHGNQECLCNHHEGHIQVNPVCPIHGQPHPAPSVDAGWKGVCNKHAGVTITYDPEIFPGCPWCMNESPTLNPPPPSGDGRGK